MDRCVLVRDEQIRTQNGEIERKYIIIAGITIKMNELQEWMKTMKERTTTPVLFTRQMWQLCLGVYQTATVAAGSS